MKNIRIKIFFFSFLMFLIFISNLASGQSKIKNIYSGGMLIIQPGYCITENQHQVIKDASYGIGGILRFYLGNYITTGIYGGSQKVTYKTNQSQNSYINFGYGGPFLGFSLKKKKFRYTLSAFAGKGSIKNLHIENQNNFILTEAYLYKTSTWVISPILSADYILNQRLSITLQTIFLTADFNDKTFYNPTIQLGILFNR